MDWSLQHCASVQKLCCNCKADFQSLLHSWEANIILINKPSGKISHLFSVGAIVCDLATSKKRKEFFGLQSTCEEHRLAQGLPGRKNKCSGTYKTSSGCSYFETWELHERELVDHGSKSKWSEIMVGAALVWMSLYFQLHWNQKGQVLFINNPGACWFYSYSLMILCLNLEYQSSRVFFFLVDIEET